MLQIHDEAWSELVFFFFRYKKTFFEDHQGFQEIEILFKQWEINYKIGLSWLQPHRHVLDKCSTVCEVASGMTPREADITGQRFSFLETKVSISTCLCFKEKGEKGEKGVALVLYCLFVYWHLNEESWLEDQDSGFRNRAIKHSLRTRQLILGYRGSTKMHKTRGTPPWSFRQPWVSVENWGGIAGLSISNRYVSESVSEWAINRSRDASASKTFSSTEVTLINESFVMLWFQCIQKPTYYPGM